MAVTDLWFKRDGTRSKRYGRGLRWRVVHPHYESRAFADRRDADVYWAHVLAADANHIEAPPSRSVGELVNLWLEGKAGLSRGGLDAYRAGAQHVRVKWGETRVDALTRHEIQAWLARLVVDDPPRTASVASRAKALQVLRGACEIARELGLIGVNPCVGVRVGRAVRRDPHFLNVAQLRVLAEAARGGAALVWLLGTSGLRIGEATALDVRHVDAGRQRLRIPRSKTGRGRGCAGPYLGAGDARSGPIA